MAQSKVNDKYTYQEDKFLVASDKGVEAPLYYIELFGKKSSNICFSKFC